MSTSLPVDLVRIGGTLFFILFLASLSQAWRRLYWHPLRKIPGPLLAGLTGWWEFYFDVVDNGTLVKVLPGLHRQYQSPVIRISPNHVHVNDPDFYHVVYRSGTDYRKAPHFYKALIYPEALIAIMDPKRHRVFRNTIAPLFSPAAIDLCAPRIHQVVMKAAVNIRRGLEDGTPVDIQRLFRCFSVDVIYVALFGQQDEFVKDYEHPHALITSMDQITHGMWLAKHFPIINQVAPYLPPALSSSKLSGYARFRKQCEAWVEEVRQRRDQGQLTTPDGIVTIFDAMLEPSEEKGYQARTSKELIDEAALFILAGSDTSAYTLTTATYYLLTNAHALSKLRDELDMAEPLIRDKCNWEETRKLPYLMAVVKEALRLSTPVPGITPRIVPEAGVKVQDYFLPGGTIVSVTHRTIHDNTDIFPDPSKFQPERWLGERGKALDRWLVAFSKGSRQCVGSPMAYQELAMTISQLFGRFDLELHETDESSMEWVDNVVAVNREPVRVTVLRDRWV
ncbi:cytochrome P450 [Aspergillus cavernicola]|uniref:Cytochrome P450 n=1 Tax=Aspergillus cavernicola TaxID=176166 RepID=A0ABR4HM78_9EURO